MTAAPVTSLSCAISKDNLLSESANLAMNNPISTCLKRPPPGVGRSEERGNLCQPDTARYIDHVSAGYTHAAKSNKANEPFEWETEWDEKDADWLSETGDVLRLAFLAPITTVELVAKSMVPSENEERAMPRIENEEIDWGSGQEWLEEIGHVFKLSLSAPVNCIELLGKAIPDSEEDDQITI